MDFFAVQTLDLLRWTPAILVNRSIHDIDDEKNTQYYTYFRILFYLLSLTQYLENRLTDRQVRCSSHLQAVIFLIINNKVENNK